MPPSTVISRYGVPINHEYWRILRVGEAAGALLRTSDNLPRNASAQAVAEALGFLVIIDPNLPPVWHGALEFDSMLILVRPRPTERATDWSISHELAHHALLNALVGAELETSVQRCAAAIKMPSGDFLGTLRDRGRNPHLLQLDWPHCSLASLAFRQSDLEPRLVVSVYDNGALVRRRWSEGACLDIRLDRAEQAARTAARGNREGYGAVERAWGRCEAWRTSHIPFRAIVITESWRKLL